MLLSSCNTKPAETDKINTDIQNTNQNENVVPSEEATGEVRMDPYIFGKKEPIAAMEVSIEAHSYKGAPKTHTQSYKLKRHKALANFKDAYGEKKFKRAEFEYSDSYDYFYALCTYKQYLYFLVSEGTEHRIFRYDMQNDVSEDVFTYTSENSITLAAVNDEYLIWKEDENANWLKVTMHCYNMNTETDETVYVYPREKESDMMLSWSFETPIFHENYLYFSATVGKTDGKSDINLYRYNLESKEIETVCEKRATRPLPYKGLSWLGFDDERGEYVIRNIDESVKPIYMGKKYAELHSSSKYIVGYKSQGSDAIMYFDGANSVPIIETSGNFDGICCSDDFIMWNGWSNDYPMFYDIGRNMIVYVNVIEGDRQYKPYLSDDYLVFEAKDTVTADGLTTTKKLIYYYIATDELN